MHPLLKLFLITSTLLSFSYAEESIYARLHAQKIEHCKVKKNPLACEVLGLSFKDAKNLKKASEFFMLACDYGSKNSCLRAGKTLQELKSPLAEKYLTIACNKGFFMGACFDIGLSSEEILLRRTKAPPLSIDKTILFAPKVDVAISSISSKNNTSPDKNSSKDNNDTL